MENRFLEDKESYHTRFTKSYLIVRLEVIKMIS